MNKIHVFTQETRFPDYKMISECPLLRLRRLLSRPPPPGWSWSTSGDRLGPRRGPSGQSS